MSEHNLLLLAQGIVIGALLMLLLEIALDMRADRRQRKQLAAAHQHITETREKAGQ